ncbi:hypothetical protein PMIN01_07682 [Paraphaeosphaeria minitans]|uniref:Uncharacterized protein n=1 Tax=Paraphaeosphaeria minitans TaxID=565426 RepID=A0A9P6GIH6_9PLEO|nr:hypothetical protein PMIN01_07682 [Paraphaeosphaeria minitans]
MESKTFHIHSHETTHAEVGPLNTAPAVARLCLLRITYERDSDASRIRRLDLPPSHPPARAAAKASPSHRPLSSEHPPEPSLAYCAANGTYMCVSPHLTSPRLASLIAASRQNMHAAGAQKAALDSPRPKVPCPKPRVARGGYASDFDNWAARMGDPYLHSSTNRQRVYATLIQDEDAIQQDESAHFAFFVVRCWLRLRLRLRLQFGLSSRSGLRTLLLTVYCDGASAVVSATSSLKSSSVVELGMLIRLNKVAWAACEKNCGEERRAGQALGGRLKDAGQLKDRYGDGTLHSAASVADGKQRRVAGWQGGRWAGGQVGRWAGGQVGGSMAPSRNEMRQGRLASRGSSQRAGLQVIWRWRWCWCWLALAGSTHGACVHNSHVSAPRTGDAPRQRSGSERACGRGNAEICDQRGSILARRRGPCSVVGSTDSPSAHSPQPTARSPQPTAHSLLQRNTGKNWRRTLRPGAPCQYTARVDITRVEITRVRAHTVPDLCPLPVRRRTSRLLPTVHSEAVDYLRSTHRVYLAHAALPTSLCCAHSLDSRPSAAALPTSTQTTWQFCAIEKRRPEHPIQQAWPGPGRPFGTTPQGTAASDPPAQAHLAKLCPRGLGALLAVVLGSHAPLPSLPPPCRPTTSPHLSTILDRTA